MVRSFVIAIVRPPLARSAARLRCRPLPLEQARDLAERRARPGRRAARIAARRGAARRIVTSEVAERAVAEAFAGPLVDAVTRRLLESEELWLLVQEVAQSPAVTAAITHQGASFAEEVADEVREQSQDADAWLERAARRMLRRPRRRRRWRRSPRPGMSEARVGARVRRSAMSRAASAPACGARP